MREDRMWRPWIEKMPHTEGLFQTKYLCRMMKTITYYHHNNAVIYLLQSRWCWLEDSQHKPSPVWCSWPGNVESRYFRANCPWCRMCRCRRSPHSACSARWCLLVGSHPRNRWSIRPRSRSKSWGLGTGFLEPLGGKKFKHETSFTK